MGCKSTLLTAVSILASAGLGVAQNFFLDEETPYGPNTFRPAGPAQIDGTVWFNDVDQQSGGPLYGGVSGIGLQHTTVVFGDGREVTAYDFCAEIFRGPNSSDAYTVTGGLSALTLLPHQEAAIGALFSHALPDYASASGDDALLRSAAMQLALWEIIEDGDALIFTLDEGHLNSGLLSVNTAETDDDLITSSAVSKANEWLNEINSGTWTDLGTYQFYHAASAAGQDRLWVVPVPEPSTSLLGLVGLALALRRRRN